MRDRASSSIGIAGINFLRDNYEITESDYPDQRIKLKQRRGRSLYDIDDVVTHFNEGKTTPALENIQNLVKSGMLELNADVFRDCEVVAYGPDYIEVEPDFGRLEDATNALQSLLMTCRPSSKILPAGYWTHRKPSMHWVSAGEFDGSAEGRQEVDDVPDIRFLRRNFDLVGTMKHNAVRLSLRLKPDVFLYDADDIAEKKESEVLRKLQCDLLNCFQEMDIDRVKEFDFSSRWIELDFHDNEARDHALKILKGIGLKSIDDVSNFHSSIVKENSVRKWAKENLDLIYNENQGSFTFTYKKGNAKIPEKDLKENIEAVGEVFTASLQDGGVHVSYAFPTEDGLVFHVGSDPETAKQIFAEIFSNERGILQ